MGKKLSWLLAVASGVLAADQWTKFLALQYLTAAFDGVEGPWRIFLGAPPSPSFEGFHFRPTSHVVFSDDFFRLRYAENPAAAFGVLGWIPDEWRSVVFRLVALGVMVGIVLAYVRLRGGVRRRPALWGLPLVLGGALGNAVDRLIHGFVIDFVEVHWLERAYWPAFNLADSAIVVGIGLWLLDTWTHTETASTFASSAKSD